jgi:hypothetical protein
MESMIDTSSTLITRTRLLGVISETVIYGWCVDRFLLGNAGTGKV